MVRAGYGEKMMTATNTGNPEMEKTIRELDQSKTQPRELTTDELETVSGGRRVNGSLSREEFRSVTVMRP
jgi:bacteriocin-like protein